MKEKAMNPNVNRRFDKECNLSKTYEHFWQF